MRTIVLFVILMLSVACFSMERAVFEKNMGYLNKGELAKVEPFLTESINQYEKDPDYYVILLNYSYRKSRQSGIVVAQGKPQGDDLAVSDQETNEVVGFLGEHTSFDNDIVVAAIDKTRSAMTHFPNRLDIHFGITHIAKEAKLWNLVSKQSLEVLKISKQNNNEWQWGSISSMPNNAKAFMLQNIAGNCSHLFNAENDVADKGLEAVSLSLIENYPNEVYGYANLGSLNAVKKNYEKAYEYYSKALKVAPNDEVVLANLRHLETLIKQ